MQKMVVLLLLLVVPISVWGASKKNKPKEPAEDPAGWYMFGYDSKKCQAYANRTPLDYIDVWAMSGKQIQKEEVEKDGKVVRATVWVPTEYGPIATFFVKGKTECEEAFSQTMAKEKQRQQARQDRYR